MSDEIIISRSDLQGLQQLLSSVYNAHSAQDLVDQYRKLDNRNRRSPLTRAIENGMDTINGYLDVDDAQDEDEPDA